MLLSNVNNHTNNSCMRDFFEIKYVIQEKKSAQSIYEFNEIIKIILVLITAKDISRISALKTLQSFMDNKVNWHTSFKNNFNKDLLSLRTDLKVDALIKTILEVEETEDVDIQKIRRFIQQGGSITRYILDNQLTTSTNLKKSLSILNEVYHLYHKMLCDIDYSPQTQNELMNVLFTPYELLKEITLTEFREKHNIGNSYNPIDKIIQKFLHRFKTILGGKANEWDHIWPNEKYEIYKNILSKLKLDFEHHKNNQ